MRLSPSVYPPRQNDSLSAALALVIGASITLCVYGYQFGRSNHTIYLLWPLHLHDPKLLANDWFTMQTFQYHAAFGWLTRALMAMHALEGGYLIVYLLLVIAFHIAWLRLVVLLGGTFKTYLASVLMYHLSAGGTGLGMYQFLQDSSVLASNIANVLLFCGIVLWIDRRGIASGVCVGLAGMFHLNHALVGSGLWIALNIWDALSAARRDPSMAISRATLPLRDRRFWIASLSALVPCFANIGYALALTWRQVGKMPFNDFIELYVHFRHPHHYDPRTWPAALWISFLWPVVPAIGAFVILRHTAPPSIRRALLDTARIFLLIWLLLIIALLGAGFWYVSEALVQMSLYRFSIYVQLFACVGAALLVCDCTRVAGASVKWAMFALGSLVALTPLLIWIGPRLGWISVSGMTTFINHKRGGLLLFAALSCAPAIHELFGAIRHHRLRAAAQCSAMLSLVALIVVGWRNSIGLTQIFEKTDDRYLALCTWVREHTPTGTVFVVPPQESEFRYHAQRAIVVNFKAVPQLSSELAQWQARLEDVLGTDDLLSLPRRFDRIGPAMAQLYASRSADELIQLAHKYHAGYIVTTHPYDDRGLKLVRNLDGQYLLYAVTR